MTATTARELFRQAVADVAAKAKATLPACNGRVESAVTLVLLDEVQPHDDGTITVGSTSDPLTTHLLSSTSCSCDDFQYHRAPDGWCKHRIAAGLHKRVGQLLAGHGVPSAAPAPCPEALFSLTLKGKLDGIETLLTVRGTTAAEFQANLASVRGLLDAHGPQTSGTVQPASQPPAEGWCAVHDEAMKLQEKAGRRWYSHWTPAGWCKGK